MAAAGGGATSDPSSEPARLARLKTGGRNSTDRSGARKGGGAQDECRRARSGRTGRNHGRVEQPERGVHRELLVQCFARELAQPPPRDALVARLHELVQRAAQLACACVREWVRVCVGASVRVCVRGCVGAWARAGVQAKGVCEHRLYEAVKLEPDLMLAWCGWGEGKRGGWAAAALEACPVRRPSLVPHAAYVLQSTRREWRWSRRIKCSSTPRQPTGTWDNGTLRAQSTGLCCTPYRTRDRRARSDARRNV